MCQHFKMYFCTLYSTSRLTHKKDTIQVGRVNSIYEYLPDILDSFKLLTVFYIATSWGISIIRYCNKELTEGINWQNSTLFAVVLLGFTFPTSLLVFRLPVWQVAPFYEDDGRKEKSQQRRQKKAWATSKIFPFTEELKRANYPTYVQNFPHEKYLQLQYNMYLHLVESTASYNSFKLKKLTAHHDHISRVFGTIQLNCAFTRKLSGAFIDTCLLKGRDNKIFYCNSP